MPRWEYLIGVAIILLLIYMGYIVGYWRGSAKDNNISYQRGYAHGREAGKAEFLRQPFKARPGKPPLPRPKSAGTVRVHKARVRGDVRPFDERPDQQIYPRTKMVRPTEFDEKLGDEWRHS